MVGVAQHAEEHTIHADRSLDDVGSVAFAAFGIEVFDFLTAELGVLRKVEVSAGVHAFHFLEAEGHLELDVAGGVGIVREFLVIVEAIVLRAEAEGLVPGHAAFFPVGKPVQFVAEGLTNLCDAEGDLHAAGLLHVEVVDKDALCRFGTEVDGVAAFGSRSHFGLEHEVELTHLCPVARAADGANDLFVEDNLAQSFEVRGVHGHGIALVEGIALLDEFAHTAVGGAEFGFVKRLFEALAAFGHFFLDLLVVLGHLVLDEDVGAVAFLGILVVDERIVEGIDVSGSLPDGGVHEDGGVDAHDVLVQQRHGLPPILFDIVFQLHTELTVVVNGAETVVDFTGREHKTVLFAVRYDFLENVFLCHAVFFVIVFGANIRFFDELRGKSPQLSARIAFCCAKNGHVAGIALRKTRAKFGFPGKKIYLCGNFERGQI